MEAHEKKCSSTKHDQIAISYCHSCKIYMCSKCINFHSELFGVHQTKNLNNKVINQIFTGFCTEEKHNNELEYFCKSHNILCCAACISKIQSKGNGQHKNCDVCNIEDIKDDKKNKLKENILFLEDLSNSLEQFLNELKIIFEKINTKKEKIKLEIQKTFIELRNTLNEREVQILFELDEHFNKLFFNKEIIKESEQLPKKVKISLETGKSIEKVWEENKIGLNSLIKECINIENNLKDIKDINEKIRKFNSQKIEFKFHPDKIENNGLLDNIKKFGNLELKIDKDDEFKNNNKLGKLLKEKDIDLLSNWIKSDNKKIQKINFELCYDAKSNGDDKNNFHKFCDNIGPSLLVIKTESNYIFGGYTKENWETKEFNYKEDNTAFLFSINNKKKIKVKNSKRAIVNDIGYGPIFGHGNAYEICLYYPFLSNEMQMFDKGDYGDKVLILTGNESKKPIEIEVYKVLFSIKKYIK